MKKFFILLTFFYSYNLYSAGYVNFKGIYNEINSKYAFGGGLDAGFFLSRNLAFEGYFDYLNFKENDTMHFGFKVAYFFLKRFSLKFGAGIYNTINSDENSNFELIAAPGFYLPITRTTYFTVEGIYKHLTDNNKNFLDHSYGASLSLMFIL